MTPPSLHVGALRVSVARGFVARLVGLLGQRGLAPGHGLLLAPCNNVHTCFMRFAIDVVFIDRAGVVIAIVPHLAPWRVAVARRAHACLELAAGGASACGVAVGQQLAQLAAASLAR